MQGTVTGIPAGQTATVTATTGEEQAGVTGAYSLCVSAGASSSSETLTAQVGTPSCDGWTGSTNVSVVAGQTYTGKDIAVTAEPSCPQGGTPPPAQCTAPTISNEYSDYITVTVRYPVSIFVPFIGPLFQTSAGVRMITTSVTYAIEPCTFTKGN